MHKKYLLLSLCLALPRTNATHTKPIPNTKHQRSLTSLSQKRRKTTANTPHKRKSTHTIIAGLLITTATALSLIYLTNNPSTNPLNNNTYFSDTDTDTFNNNTYLNDSDTTHPDTSTPYNTKPHPNQPITLTNANPFKLSTGFKTFNINWEQSTLNEKDTLASVLQHQDKLNNIQHHPQYIWPFFITFRLCHNTILHNPQWANLFLSHHTDDIYKTPYTHNPYQKFQQDYLQNKPRFFHRTKFKNIQPILQSGLLKVTQSPKPGVFVSVGGTAEKTEFGNITLCFRDLDLYDLPLTILRGANILYLGFWNDINLKKLLTHIYVEATEQNTIPTIQQYLHNYGYHNINVSIIPQDDIQNKDMHNEYQKNTYNNGVYTLGPKIVPTFYPIQGNSSTLYLNKNNEKIVCSPNLSTMHTYDLYKKNKQIAFFNN